MAYNDKNNIDYTQKLSHVDITRSWTRYEERDQALEERASIIVEEMTKTKEGFLVLLKHIREQLVKVGTEESVGINASWNLTNIIDAYEKHNNIGMSDRTQELWDLYQIGSFTKIENAIDAIDAVTGENQLQDNADDTQTQDVAMPEAIEEQVVVDDAQKPHSTETAAEHDDVHPMLQSQDVDEIPEPAQEEKTDPDALLNYAISVCEDHVKQKGLEVKANKNAREALKNVAKVYVQHKSGQMTVLEQKVVSYLAKPNARTGLKNTLAAMKFLAGKWDYQKNVTHSSRYAKMLRAKVGKKELAEIREHTTCPDNPTPDQQAAYDLLQNDTSAGMSILFIDQLQKVVRGDMPLADIDLKVRRDLPTDFKIKMDDAKASIGTERPMSHRVVDANQSTQQNNNDHHL